MLLIALIILFFVLGGGGVVFNLLNALSIGILLILGLWILYLIVKKLSEGR